MWRSLKAGLTQEGLAFNAGIHVTFISEIERGKKKPSIESLEKILAVLKIELSEFFNYNLNASDILIKPTLEKLINELSKRSDPEIELIYNIALKIFTFEDKTKNL